MTGWTQKQIDEAIENGNRAMRRAAQAQQQKPKQTLQNTHAIYDNFEKLANFVNNQASPDEIAAIADATRPLIEALSLAEAQRKHMGEFMGAQLYENPTVPPGEIHVSPLDAAVVQKIMAGDNGKPDQR